MVELSDGKYWKKLKYQDGLLYCSLLNIDGKDDWRMMAIADNVITRSNYIGSFWYYEDINHYPESLELLVIPVRDI